MPEDAEDNDCHVVNEVWLPELGKWAMIDTDMGGHYFSDLKGVPFSSGFQPYRIGGGNTITSDADQFWAAPVIDRL